MVSLEPKKQKRQNLHYPFSPKSSHSTYQSRMTVLAEYPLLAIKWIKVRIDRHQLLTKQQSNIYLSVAAIVDN